MNADRVLRLESGHILVAVNCGRASVPQLTGDDAIIPYECGERAYVVRYDYETPELVRIADKQSLGRVNLRNWEAVSLCDACLGEFAEKELRECSCGSRQCVACVDGHSRPCGKGHPGTGGAARQKVLIFKQPKRRRSKS